MDILGSLNLLAALASAVAAIAAWRVSKDALQASRASLFAELLKSYSDRQMGDDLTLLYAFHDQEPKTTGPRFHEQLLGFRQARVAPAFEDVFHARRRVSQYFKNLVRLCEADLIDPRTVATAFGARVFDSCINVLAPLDEAQSQAANDRPDDPRWVEYYRRLHGDAHREGRT